MRKYNYKCKICGNKLQKNGKNRNGKQRWKCTNCLTSKIDKRSDLTKKHQLELFVNWLLTKKTTEQVSRLTRQGFWKQTKWCWNIDPILPVVIKHCSCIFLDAIYLRRGIACLIARDEKCVIAFEWALSESEEDWSRLISKIPEPHFAVIDGNPGCLKAISKYWKNTQIQRCLFHVFQFVRSKLSLKPKTDAARELLTLSKQLFHIANPQMAIYWRIKLFEWGKRNNTLLNERTISQTSKTPTGRPKKWFTHRNLRAAYSHLINIANDEVAFTYLGNNIPNTNNHVEGGVNSRLSELRRSHRDISEENEMKLWGWYLVSRCEFVLTDLIKKSTQKFT
jgi:hypothetical protein